MHKDLVVAQLGGTADEVARRLGVTVDAVRKWEVDEDGHLTSRAVADRVLAYFVRQRAREMLLAGLPLDPVEANMAYMPRLKLPECADALDTI